jgi:predicted SprT family Zn-dependent metalloprotease
MVVNVSGRYYLAEGIEDHLGKDFMQRIKEDGFIDVVKNEIGNLLVYIQHGHVYLMT